MNIQTKWNYLAKGWHLADEDIWDKVHALVSSVTEAMLLYLCQLPWPNSPRRTFAELIRCLVGDGRPTKESWLTVEKKVQCYEKQKEKNTSNSIESRDQEHKRVQCAAYVAVLKGLEIIWLCYLYVIYLCCCVYFACWRATFRAVLAALQCMYQQWPPGVFTAN